MNSHPITVRVTVSSSFGKEDVFKCTAKALGLVDVWEKTAESPYDEVPAWRNEQIQTLWIVEQNREKKIYSIYGKIPVEIFSGITSVDCTNEYLNGNIARILGDNASITILETEL